MAATVAGALKALIESAGLGLSVYREDAPEGAALPYVIVYENVATLHQRAGRTRGQQRIVETVQVDLWQARSSEVYSLRDRLTHLLATRTPGKAGTSPIRLMNLASSNRLASDDDSVLGHSWNVDLWRAVDAA